MKIKPIDPTIMFSGGRRMAGRICTLAVADYQPTGWQALVMDCDAAGNSCVAYHRLVPSDDLLVVALELRVAPRCVTLNATANADRILQLCLYNSWSGAVITQEDKTWPWPEDKIDLPYSPLKPLRPMVKTRRMLPEVDPADEPQFCIISEPAALELLQAQQSRWPIVIPDNLTPAMRCILAAMVDQIEPLFEPREMPSDDLPHVSIPPGPESLQASQASDAPRLKIPPSQLADPLNKFAHIES